MEKYEKCPHCDGDVKIYSLPPHHKEDCQGQYETSEYTKAKEGCNCPYESVMECEKCSRLLDVGDYEDSELPIPKHLKGKKEATHIWSCEDPDLEDKIERFVEQGSRPWK